MANDLTGELHRTLILHALSKINDPRLMKAIMSSNPNEDSIVSGLRRHNDAQHDQLRQLADFSGEKVERSSPAEPTRRKATPFDDATNRTREIFDNLKSK